MTKEEFNNLEVLEQLEYINKLLKNKQTLRKISSDLNMSKTTFRDRALKIGYIYNPNTKQYTKDNNIKVEIHKNNIKVPQQAIKPIREPIENNNIKELQKYNNDILELINHKSDILKMLKNYKNNTNIIKPQLDINNLPQELQKNITNKSIKVYEPVYKQFNELCKYYSSIKKQDLISLAILEFYQKYKK